MGMFSEGVEVDCSPSGQPVKLEWAGRTYIVCAEPIRWYERRQWWTEESRAPLGSGPGLVDHEIWRVQVKPADQREPQQPDPQLRDPQQPDPNSGQEFLTLDLTRNAGSGRWRLLRIHDALNPRTA
jgi:hypothetical protein